MVKKGDTIETVIKYIDLRIKHLKLEREVIPFRAKKEEIQKGLDTISSKITELDNVKRILNGDINNSAKYEWSKWQHLKKMKDFANEKKVCPFCKKVFEDYKEFRNHVEEEKN